MLRFQPLLSIFLMLLYILGIADGETTKVKTYVDANSTQAIENGTQTAPYKTIRKALAKAPKNSVILVQSATYQENITISDGQLVKGVGDERPVIQAADKRKPTVILNGNAQIEFLKLTRGSDGILVKPSSRVVIKASEVVSNQGDGIKFDEPTGEGEMPSIAYIMDNLISQNSDGIDLEDTLGLIQNNKLFRNRDDGLDYDGDSSVKTIGNEITDNKDDGIEIRIYKNVSADIEGNTISGNGEDGIEIINTPLSGPTTNRVHITNNTIRQNARYGIGCVNQRLEEVKETFDEGVVSCVDNVVENNRKGQIVSECGCLSIDY